MAKRGAKKSGQAVVFLLAILVVLLVAFLWNADLHSLVTRKTRAQNAGDAAALAAARWQAATLNLIGRLNIAHAEALAEGDFESIDSITNMQARLCFAGPLTALAAAQAAAKKNGIPENPEFTALLREHAAEVLKYGDPIGGEVPFPEPYPGAWREYHDTLMEIVHNGVAAAPDNARFFGDGDGAHILLDPGFYDAVAGREWCWFFLNCPTTGSRTILDDFTDHSWFDPLPPPSRPLFRNCEIFGLGLDVRHLRLGAVGGLEEFLRSRHDSLAGAGADAFDTPDNWYFFAAPVWSAHWPGMSEDDEDFLPMAGPVREEFDYSGADAVTRLYAKAPLPSAKDADERRDILWTAAAKPFGHLEAGGPGGGPERLRPNAWGLVLPAFHDVRLIPLDAATSGADGSFDIDWRRHVDEHLEPYLATGALAGGCRYCGNIATFEDPAFRRRGSEWLSVNSYKCTLPSRGGGGHGGGSRRGH